MRRLSFAPLLAGILTIALLFILAQYQMSEAQSGVSNFDTVVASGDVIVVDDLTVGDDVAIGGMVTVDGNLSAGGNLQAAGFLRAAANTAISVTQGMTITPTGTFQALTAADDVSTGAIAAGAPGDLLILFNEADLTITISDTGTLKLSGNAVLAQYDSITLISTGTDWIELAQADN